MSDPTGGPIVLDTNIIVAALFKPRSQSARLLSEARRGRVRVVWDDATLRETERIVRKIPRLSWEDVVDVYRPEARFEGESDVGAFAVVPDPEDRKFAALAAAAGATLVTSDAHLLDVRGKTSARIATPGEILRQLNAEVDG